MSSKSFIMNKQGVAHAVLKLMREDIAPKDAAELYEFARPELKESFIEGLTVGQEFVSELRHFMGEKP